MAHLLLIYYPSMPLDSIGHCVGSVLKRSPERLDLPPFKTALSIRNFRPIGSSFFIAGLYYITFDHHQTRETILRTQSISVYLPISTRNPVCYA
jgi:hypothetical protein